MKTFFNDLVLKGTAAAATLHIMDEGGWLGAGYRPGCLIRMMPPGSSRVVGGRKWRGGAACGRCTVFWEGGVSPIIEGEETHGQSGVRRIQTEEMIRENRGADSEDSGYEGKQQTDHLQLLSLAVC